MSGAVGGVLGRVLEVEVTVLAASLVSVPSSAL